MQKEDHFSLSVFVYILNADKSKILMVKRNEEKRKRWGFDWGLIGGKVEPGELTVEAAIREAREEIGVEFKESQLKFMYFEERPSKIHTPAVHFCYTAVLDEKTKLDLNTESDGFEWFPVENLPKSVAEIEKLRKGVQSALSVLGPTLS